MTKKNYILPLFVTLLTTLSFNSKATGPRVTTALLVPAVNEVFALDYPAILNSELSDGGLAATLVNAAFNTEKLEHTITNVPVATMLSYYLIEDNALAVLGHDLSLNEDELKNLIVIPVLILKESYFYYQPNHEKLVWKGDLSAFKDLTIGLNKGEPEKDYQKLNIKTESNRLDVRLKSLIAGKIDVIREAEFSLIQTIKKDFVAQQTKIIKLEPNAGEMVVSILFNKKNPKGAELAKQFKQGLTKLITSGQYDEIIKAHSDGVPFEQYFKPLPK